VTCDTIGDLPDVVLLSETIKAVNKPASPVRVLMLVSETSGLEFAGELAASGAPMELLLGADVQGDPPAGVRFARMQPDSKPNDRDEFALAMSDVLWAHPSTCAHALVRRAEELGKPVVAPGGGLPILPPVASVTQGLNPHLDDGGRRWHCLCFGRLEHVIIACLGWNWTLLKRGFRRGWFPPAYFAPEACEKLAPDPDAMKPDAVLPKRFAALDSSAVLGANIHRDVAWALHLGAAFAVLAAVAGLPADEPLAVGENVAHRPNGWGFAELGALAAILLVLFVIRRCRLQDRWTACRLGAEQLRIARMCLPLLVLPRALITEDVWCDQRQGAKEAVDLESQALAEVKRAIRDQPLPQFDPRLSPACAARWLECIVKDQIDYHDNNHRKLEPAETGLRWLAGFFFLSAFIAVAVELMPHLWRLFPAVSGLLIVTAAFPAFAAAFHGASTRVGIAQRVALSVELKRELVPIHRALIEIINRPRHPDSTWVEIRELAFHAAEAMGRENKSWHGQVRLQRDTVPA
jgi:hypothetical protein